MHNRCEDVCPFTANGLIPLRFQRSSSNPAAPAKVALSLPITQVACFHKRIKKNNTIVLEQTTSAFQKREEDFKVYICDYHTYLQLVENE